MNARVSLNTNDEEYYNYNKNYVFNNGYAIKLPDYVFIPSRQSAVVLLSMTTHDEFSVASLLVLTFAVQSDCVQMKSFTLHVLSRVLYVGYCVSMLPCVVYIAVLSVIL